MDEILQLSGCHRLDRIHWFRARRRCKGGQMIYVSSGASGVGSMVIQICKIKRLKVIGSAGTDAKVDFIRSIGADVVSDYKTTPFAAALQEHGPIDLFWDNVGGEQLH
ncbi:Zinc-type alcohol dehydrogenase-like protein PB24D3.08c [Mycena venus]|uniref:Zinc-type alcohol dehydrogenase-like protein PB24D3.08c n=1 Tax=Mycena venus TaxID=2733690 RepID=A0A8H6Y458_9AGAR|nr:Zinc-type alcohol dehydrogenase-like protein PB24D3.08c [Mycena venus]